MKSKTQKQDEALARQKQYDALPLEVKIQRCLHNRGESNRQLAKLLALTPAEGLGLPHMPV